MVCESVRVPKLVAGFQGFNKEMEEIARVQRGYSIPDVELRESLKRDNKEYILPKYNAFYERYLVTDLKMEFFLREISVLIIADFSQVRSRAVH